MTGRRDTTAVLLAAQRALHWSELAHDEAVAADEAAKRLSAHTAMQRLARSTESLRRSA